MATLQTLLDGRAFLEGPRWHEGALYVSDMHAHEVLRVSSDGAAFSSSRKRLIDVEVLARLDTAPSGLGWLPDGSMLIVSMDDRKLLRRGDDGSLTEHADLSGLAQAAINDMLVNDVGYAFISQFGSDIFHGEAFQPAALLRVDPGGSVHEVVDDLRFANGMVVTADRSTLVVAESAGARLLAFSLGPDGTLSDQRVWAALPEGEFPDGICIDAEDAIWFSSPTTSRFARVREGGEITDAVETPGRHAIACALGGDDGRTLFCCTAPTLGLPDQSRALRGAKVETVTVSVAAPA
jgi:sugar lactone lactonase YvrE